MTPCQDSSIFSSLRKMIFDMPKNEYEWEIKKEVHNTSHSFTGLDSISQSSALEQEKKRSNQAPSVIRYCDQHYVIKTLCFLHLLKFSMVIRNPEWVIFCRFSVEYKIFFLLFSYCNFDGYRLQSHFAFFPPRDCCPRSHI